MLRGYRLVIIAAFGWLSLAAAPQPSGNNQTEQTKSAGQPNDGKAPIAVTISKPVEVVQPKVNEPPCGPNQYQAKDDLCAQWKAADAAGRAATWAMIGTLVAAVGTFGLYWQIILTRRAVEDTGEATKTMREANELAQKAFEFEHRPWLHVEVIFTRTFGAFDISMTVKNSGNAPALDVRYAFERVSGEASLLAGFRDYHLKNRGRSIKNIPPRGDAIIHLNREAVAGTLTQITSFGLVLTYSGPDRDKIYDTSEFYSVGKSTIDVFPMPFDEADVLRAQQGEVLECKYVTSGYGTMT